MIVLVPVSQFSVRYEVVGGRPYSRFEQLVLRAIDGGLTSLGELEQEFKLHSRLIIEALVTLTQAGWIAVGERGFSLTEEGRRAVLSGELPETRISEERRGRVLMERLTGGVISGQRATFITDSDLREAGKWEAALRVPPRIHESMLDGGQVQHCLARHRNEWIARVGPVRLGIKEGCWIPVNVDLGRSKVSLLPSEWYARLEHVIIREAEKLGAGLGESAKGERWQWSERADRKARYQLEKGNSSDVWGTQWKVDVKPDDFVFSVDEHRELMSKALKEAKAQVFIVSAFLRLSVLQELEEAFVDAVRRGVYIDILWGFIGDSEESGAKAVECLQKIAADAHKVEGGRGRIRFNRDPSGSHAKVLLWDSWTGMRVCVGSFNWLSVRSLPEGCGIENNASVCFRHPGLLSAVARTVAGLWMRTRSERLGSTAARLEAVSAELDRLYAKSPREEEVGERVGLVRDLEHEGLLNALLRSPKSRFLLSSFHLTEVGRLRLLALSSSEEQSKLSGCVAFSECTLSSEDEAALRARLENRNLPLLRSAGLHAKVCLGDSVAYVGSYNFLSGDPFSTASGAREIGVVISGEGSITSLIHWAKRRGLLLEMEE